MKSPETSPVPALDRSLCVLFPGALGDFICFLPALTQLAKLAPVDLLARREFAAIVPKLVNVSSAERYEVRRLFAPDACQDERLQRFFSGYAAVYSWLGSRQSAFVDQLCNLSNGRARVFPFRPSGGPSHQTDYYLSCLNLPAVGALPLVELLPEAISWCQQFWTRHRLRERPVLAIGPGSGAREKNWPEEYYLAAARWWRERTGGDVIVLVGPVEEERGGIDQLSAHSVVACGLELSQLAALLSRCVLYLGNDSGVSHLAAAVGVRTVTLFGPSDEREWAPRGRKVTVLRRDIECSPCSTDALKSCPHRACLVDLTAQEVIEHLERLPEVATLTRGGWGIKV
jgi:ADP-heptose:LPS heptosyltransferase